MSYIMLVDARGVTINLSHEIEITRMREYFNTIFKKFSIAKHLSFKSQKNAVVFLNVLTNLGP